MIVYKIKEDMYERNEERKVAQGLIVRPLPLVFMMDAIVNLWIIVKPFIFHMDYRLSCFHYIIAFFLHFLTSFLASFIISLSFGASLSLLFSFIL